MNEAGVILSHTFMMMIYGLLTHFLLKMKHYRTAFPDTRFWCLVASYYRDNPFATILAIIGAVAGYSMLYGSAELTRATAYGLGYMADGVADTIGNRSIKNLKDKDA